MSDVVVIGGGLNGLVAGAWLARHKLKTTIVEQRDLVGGAAVTSELAPGFRAPTLSHSLGPISREVMRAFHLDRAGVEIIAPEPALTTLGARGESIVFHRDPVLTAGSIHGLSAADAGRWSAFLQTSQRIGALIDKIQRQPPPPLDEISAGEWWRLAQLGRGARKLGRQDLTRLARWVPMSIADLTEEWFGHDLLRAAIAAHGIFGHPAGPRSAGTGAMWLQRIAADPMPVGGGATARGGPGVVTETLARIAEKSGAVVRTAAHVVRISTRNGRVTGVVLGNGDEIAARAVIAAVDPRQTFLSLVDPMDLPPSFVTRVSHFRARGVTAKINLALSSAPAFESLGADEVPLRGRFLIAPNLDYLERAFDASKYGERSPEPWLELTVPTMADPSLAPERQHVISMHVHYAPRELRGRSWNTEGEALYRSAVTTLEAHVPRLISQIVGREILTPEDFEQRWGLSGGHIFHGEMALDQSWIARPVLGWARYRTPVPGLYLGGAGAHPGGGLTGRPGLLAAQTVVKDWKELK
jgi:phytoene dehydrogenase-like protein